MTRTVEGEPASPVHSHSRHHLQPRPRKLKIAQRQAAAAGEEGHDDIAVGSTQGHASAPTESPLGAAHSALWVIDASAAPTIREERGQRQENRHEHDELFSSYYNGDLLHMAPYANSDEDEIPYYSDRSDSLQTLPSSDLDSVFVTATNLPSAAASSGRSTSVFHENNNHAYDTRWPAALAVMFVLLFVVFTLLAAPSIGRAIATGSIRRGWYLRQSSPSVSLVKSSFAHSAQHSSTWKARARGFYNRFLLPTVPYANLTVGQCGALLLYLGCVVLAVFTQNGGPAKDVIRSGRIAVAQFPMLFALATKNSILGITGKSYERLNFLHRFAGRCTIVCCLVHSIFYLRKLDSAGSLHPSSSRIQATGIAAMTFACLILLTSFRLVRNFAYQCFMVSHIVGWVALLVATYMHVEYARPWILVSLGLLGADFLMRLSKMRFKTAILTPRGSSEVTKVEIPGFHSGWAAGQHIWIRRLSLRHGHEIHPFSIANSAEYASLVQHHLSEKGIPSTEQDGGLTLYAKSCGRWTRSLNAHAASNNDLEGKAELGEGGNCIGERKVRVCVDGPYGVDFGSNGDFETVLLVAGGSGITYILNALETIVANAIQSNSSTLRVRLIYIVRSLSSNWAFVHLIQDILASARYLCAYLDIQVEIYETATPRTPQSGDQGTKSGFLGEGIRFHKGERPSLVTSLNRALNETIHQHATASTGNTKQQLAGGVRLVTCGPRALSNASRQAARLCDQDLAYRAGGVVVHSEMFGW